MARPLRIEYDGALYHVTSRGNERKAIFRDDGDRRLFLRILAQVTDRFNWLCHAYCLMNNHYHLVIETPDGNLSKGMRQLKWSVYPSKEHGYSQMEVARYLKLHYSTISRLMKRKIKTWPLPRLSPSTLNCDTYPQIFLTLPCRAVVG